MQSKVHVYAGEMLAQYGFPDGHPFSPQRFDAFWREFTKRQLDEKSNVKICEPIKADPATIALFHDQQYIEQVKQQSLTGEGYLDQGDTPAFPGVYEAAAYVVGSSVQAMEDIMAGKCQHAFVPIAGLHHARRDSASGF
ncbi:MAG: acetoin utilization protein AcuC, partial [Gammaproteobacteria bacterium]|nr:acetoin utilization protein AcuC [Gammaproteobacteria bacterium]